MERFAYQQLAEIEDTHWWFVYRRKLIGNLLERSGGVAGELALDIGCGTGGNLPFLKRYCANVCGIDLSEYAIALAMIVIGVTFIAVAMGDDITTLWSNAQPIITTVIDAEP